MSGTSHTLIHDMLDQLCKELASRWQQGERVPAEELLAQLGNAPKAEDAVRLIYEEICLRQDRNEQVTLDELETRFPAWAQELAVLLDCHRLFRSRPLSPIFPAVGETLGDFRLVSELGRGALGVVYLARQQTLSDRPVVLKLSPRKTREHFSLARLQHTHIIPLHAIYEFPGRHLIAMCQPYLGGVTLERILEQLKPIPLHRRTGRSILDIIDSRNDGQRTDSMVPSSFRRVLAHSSYIEAICLIGACLADGLQYAHDRDLVHLDIKPSNVLITADAQPMLLDFHLAVQPIAAGAPAPEWFGGTPAYLAPEHAAAYEAAKHGRHIPVAVGSPADLFSLGKMLFVALGGEETTNPADFTSWQKRNPEVGAGLGDIIRKCMQPMADQRYAEARQLAVDLRRHLSHQPLVGVPNRSLSERWKKWKQRTPYAALAIGMMLALIAGAVVVGVLLYEHVHAAQLDLDHARDQLQRGLPQEAIYTLERGHSRLSGLRWIGSLSREYDQALTDAQRAQAIAVMQATTERLRYLAEGTTVVKLPEPLDAACRTIWKQRELIITKSPPPSESVRQSFLEFVTLWQSLNQPPRSGPVPVELTNQLAETERLLGSSSALDRQQRLLRGEKLAASEFSKLTSGSELVCCGRAMWRNGELEQAILCFEQAIDLQPGDYWPNYYLGMCQYQQKNHAAALHSFSIALALRPGVPECYYHLGLSQQALDQFEAALHSYDRALALRPELGAARLNRGHLLFQQSRYQEALADFTQALEQGADPVLGHYNLGLCYHTLKQEQNALKHVNLALNLRPGYSEALQLLAQLQQQAVVTPK